MNCVVNNNIEELEDIKLDLKFYGKNGNFFKCYEILKELDNNIELYDISDKLYIKYQLAWVLDVIGTEKSIVLAKQYILEALDVCKKLHGTSYQLILRCYTVWEYSRLFENELTIEQKEECFNRILYVFNKLIPEDEIDLDYNFIAVILNKLYLNEEKNKKEINRYLSICKQLGYEDLIKSNE